MLNLSTKVISFHQISVLSRGLTFAPTVHFDLYNTILDVNKYARNITVHRYFLNVNRAEKLCIFTSNAAVISDMSAHTSIPSVSHNNVTINN